MSFEPRRKSFCNQHHTLGRQKVALMSDGDRFIRALADAACKQWGKEVSVQAAPNGPHQSSGTVERANLDLARQVWTTSNALEFQGPAKGQILLLRNQTWSLAEFQVPDQDGRKDIYAGESTRVKSWNPPRWSTTS